MLKKNIYLLSLFILCNCNTSTEKFIGGVPPSEAISTFELPEGFQIELLASEPLISDPVAMEIDEYGRMYVVEMHGYPLDKSGSGKVKLLTDEDGDGLMDKSVVFAEGLILPTGVMRWKDGILVTDPPNVLYLEDSDGDGKADIRDTVLTGFAISNPQHNVNNPFLGIDNWIYLGHEPAVTTQLYQKEFGDRGGEVYYVNNPEGIRLPQNALGRSVRFRPDKWGLEIMSSSTQFGQTFDLFGQRLLVSNANHIYHEVIPASYLERNPDLIVPGVINNISDHGNASDVYPITKDPEYQLLTDVGVFTSACGLVYYTGGLFPPPFDSVSFVCEPVSNIVHADLIRDHGATFTASRVYENKEFLASTDSWSRPSNLYVGPDGALYVVDYYRQIIEHPEWMAEETVKSGQLYNGRDQGRIFRITPKGTGVASWSKSVHLGDLSNTEMVDKLGDPNLWWRKNAQRILIDRGASDIAEELKKMVKEDKRSMGRLHALWTLEGLGQLDSRTLLTALEDSVSGVRENAILLCEEGFLEDPAILTQLFSLQDDPNPKVRFQLLFTLGYIDSKKASEVRQKILFEDIEDPWVQIAGLSSVASDKEDLVKTAIDRFEPDNKAFNSLVTRLSSMVGASGNMNSIKRLITQSIKSSITIGWQAAILDGLANGLRGKKELIEGITDERNNLIRAALHHSDEAVRKGSIKLLGVVGLPENTETGDALELAKERAKDEGTIIDKRVEAIRFLEIRDAYRYEDLFKEILNPGEPYPVQLEALNALNSIPGETVSYFCIEKWDGFTPKLRDVAINTFLSSEARISLLLNALEDGKIDPSVIGWGRSVRLMAQKDDSLKNRARAILTKKDDDRTSVIKEYQTALSLDGNRVNGKLIFKKSCSICHQVGGEGGVDFGPDLGTVKSRSKASILKDILDPNASIADGYDLWTVDLISGETTQGLIAHESPSAITLHNQGGEEKTISRQDIVALKPLGVSTMPVGLEHQISIEEMADLIEYIKNH